MTKTTISCTIPAQFAQAAILGPELAAEINGVLTTDHAASTYGLPVLVGDDGSVYGPADLDGREIYVSGGCETVAEAEERIALMDAAARAGYKIH